MLKAALAFIPLLAGYVFVCTWHETTYLIKREDTQKVYIRAAFWGVWLFLLSLGLISFFKTGLVAVLGFAGSLTVMSMLIDEENQRTDAAFWAASLLLTLCLGLLGGYLLNWVAAVCKTPRRVLAHLIAHWWNNRDGHALNLIYEHSKRSAVARAINLLDADLDLILLRATEQGQPVSVTLRRGKVYIGYVAGAIDVGGKEDMLRLQPVMSGYHTEETMTLRITTWYPCMYWQFSEDRSFSHLKPSFLRWCFHGARSALSTCLTTATTALFRKPIQPEVNGIRAIRPSPRHHPTYADLPLAIQQHPSNAYPKHTPPPHPQQSAPAHKSG